MRIFMGPTPETLMRRASELLKAPIVSEGEAGERLENVLAMLSSERDPVIVCPNAAVRTWLQNALTREDGVIAGLKWSHPSELMRQLMHGDVGTDFLGERAVWVIYDLLREMRTNITQPRLHALENLSEKELFGFARRVKDAFASYSAYRPEWVAAWLSGEDPQDEVTAHRDYAWQRELFRALRDRGFSGLDTVERAAKGLFPIGQAWCGRRVFVFMPESVPPLLERGLRALDAAGAELAVFMLTVNVEPQGLFEVKATKTRREILARLKGMGKVEELPSSTRKEEASATRARARPSNLERMRAAFSGLNHPASNTLHDSNEFDYDESLTVVRTPDLVRSVETFVDRLELLFKADPTLKPHDVMLLFPRVADGASAVRAVFERRRTMKDGVTALLMPYRNPVDRKGTGVTSAMLEALRLVSEKCTAQQWNAWFSSPSILNALGLTRADATIAQAWLARAGFVFGIDRTHLASRMMGVVTPDDSGTLERALQRLACGAVFSDGRRSPFLDGTLPIRANDIDFDVPAVSDRADLLEKLVGLGAFFSTLAHETERREGEFASSWQPVLVDAAETLVGTSVAPALREELQRWKRLLERMAGELRETPRRTGDASKVVVNRDVVLSALGTMTTSGGSTSRPADEVTVGGLRELCMVPARVIAVFGLDAACGFPATSSRPEFDLLTSSLERGARPGDPDSEAEDWASVGLLLENARDVLHLAYERRNDTTGRPIDDPSPAVSDLLRYAATVLGVCRQTGERGLPVVTEVPSNADPAAFRSGFSLSGQVKVGNASPLRSWRSLDAVLCEALKCAGAVSRVEGADALRTADTLPSGYADAYGRLEDGAFDMRAVLRWFARPATELRRTLGLSRANASDLALEEKSAFVAAGLTPLLIAKLMDAYNKSIERGETRAQIEAQLAADPQLGLERLRAREAKVLCDGFEHATGLVARIERKLSAEGAIACALEARWTWGGKVVRMHFARVWVTTERLFLVRQRLSMAASAKNNAATGDVFEAAALLGALRTGALSIVPDRERSVEASEKLRLWLAKLSAAAPEASPKNPGPFVELILVARESSEWVAKPMIVTLGPKGKPDEWSVAPPEALLEALFRAFQAARCVPALHVFDAYVDPNTPENLTQASQLLASLVPELEDDERVRLMKSARERFLALNKAFLAARSAAKARSAALELLRQFESTARNLIGELA